MTSARGGSLLCLAYVCLMMFLPIFQLDCGPMTLDWTGVDLVTGSEGPLGDIGQSIGDTLGEGAQMVGAGESSKDLPKDWVVLALPALALLGIVALLARKRAAAVVLTVLLIGAFVYFTVVGFELERLIKSDLAETGGAALSELGGMSGIGDAEVSVKKGPAFWIGAGASVLALFFMFGGGRGKTGESRPPP